MFIAKYLNFQHYKWTVWSCTGRRVWLVVLTLAKNCATPNHILNRLRDHSPFCVIVWRKRTSVLPDALLPEWPNLWRSSRNWRAEILSAVRALWAVRSTWLWNSQARCSVRFSTRLQRIQYMHIKRLNINPLRSKRIFYVRKQLVSRRKHSLLRL